MTTAPAAPKPNRTPWIVAGILGCLVVCLLLAVVGVGGYFIFVPSAPTRAMIYNTSTPVAFGLVSPVASVTPVPTSIAVPPTLSSSNPTSGPAQPTSNPTQPASMRLTAAPTRGATTTPAPGEIIGVPTLEQPTQPGQVPPTLVPATPLPATGAPARASGKIAFSVSQGDRPEDQSIWIMNADGTGLKKLLDRATSPSFSPDGSRLAYCVVGDGVFVSSADGTGQKTKVLGDAQTWSVEWSHDGRFIAVSSQPGGRGNIVTDAVPADGSALKDPSLRRNVAIGESASWSPDDTMLAFHTCRGSTCGIFVGGSGGGDVTPVVGDDGGDPAWSPDGAKIVYQKDADGQKQLFVINVDGTGKRQLTSGSALHVDAGWSKDGLYIYYRSPQGGNWGIWRMNADGSNPTKLADNLPPHGLVWPYERIAVSR